MRPSHQAQLQGASGGDQPSRWTIPAPPQTVKMTQLGFKRALRGFEPVEGSPTKLQDNLAIALAIHWCPEQQIFQSILPKFTHAMHQTKERNSWEGWTETRHKGELPAGQAQEGGLRVWAPNRLWPSAETALNPRPQPGQGRTLQDSVFEVAHSQSLQHNRFSTDDSVGHTCQRGIRKGSGAPGPWPLAPGPLALLGWPLAGFAWPVAPGLCPWLGPGPGLAWPLAPGPGPAPGLACPRPCLAPGGARPPAPPSWPRAPWPLCLALGPGPWALGLLGPWWPPAPAPGPRPSALAPGPWALGPGPWPLGPGPWPLAPGPWPLAPGPWPLPPAPGLAPWPAWPLAPGPWPLACLAPDPGLPWPAPDPWPLALGLGPWPLAPGPAGPWALGTWALHPAVEGMPPRQATLP